MMFYQAAYVITGRCMLYMVGSSGWVLLATVVSGVSEFVQRSTMMMFDEFIRERVFRRQADEATKAQQMEIWRYDICTHQLSELATIPVLGFVAPLLRQHCKYFVLSAYMDEVSSGVHASPILALCPGAYRD